jgi:predicted DNA-binding WGR domain protein
MLTLLHRINWEKNEARYYLVMTGPSLFHEIAVIRFWGRIGGFQRHLITPCGSVEDAQNLADRLVAKKLKRGYLIVTWEDFMKCVEPGKITDEQIIAYVDGEADVATIEHVRCCAYCTGRARAYDLDQRALRAALYRVDCPEAQFLGEYHLGLLSPADQDAIEAHLRDCSLCTADLAKLERFLEETDAG